MASALQSLDLDRIPFMGNKQEAVKLLKDAIKTTLINSYNQDRSIKNAYGKGSDVASGVCLALSLHWIKQHHANKETTRAGVYGVLSEDRAIIEARTLQLSYEAARANSTSGSDIGRTTDAVRQAASTEHMSLVGSIKQLGFDESVGSEIKSLGGYSILCMMGFGTGHALGSYLSRGKFGSGFSRNCYIFDPNFGEFKVPEADLGYFFPILKQLYAKHGQQYQHCGVGKINP